MLECKRSASLLTRNSVALNACFCQEIRIERINTDTTENYTNSPGTSSLLAKYVWKKSLAVKEG